VISIRAARPGDARALLDMVRELARYEKAEHEVVATEEHFARALFADCPRAFAHVAECDGVVVGFALWFVNFSTWLGTHGIYLEDLYVKPAHRRSGAGRALVCELARLCVDRGYGRLDWAVLDWNEPALRFYEALGAHAQREWLPHRLTGDALRALAHSR
jgi:GNAT superfamily N-acetyltransferase